MRNDYYFLRILNLLFSFVTKGALIVALILLLTFLFQDIYGQGKAPLNKQAVELTTGK